MAEEQAGAEAAIPNASHCIGTEVWRSDLNESERARLAEVLQAFADDPFLRQVAARSLTLMALAPAQRVLDVGCGSGVLLPALAQAVAPDGHVVGVDYAAPLLAEARARVEAAGVGDRVELHQGDAHRLPFPDAAFDAAHAERVLMHLEDPALALRELQRVVKPGGWVVTADPDYGGLRVDHPDQEAQTALNEFALASFRNPTIGLEMKRRMVAADLVDCRLEVLVETENALHPMSLASMERAAASAVAAGRLPPARAEAAITYLREADARGTYAAYDHMVVAAGRVPPA